MHRRFRIHSNVVEGQRILDHLYATRVIPIDEAFLLHSYMYMTMKGPVLQNFNFQLHASFLVGCFPILAIFWPIQVHQTEVECLE